MLLRFILLLLFISCSSQLRNPASIKTRELVWSEEFDDLYQGAPNSKFWDFEDSVRNHEAQCYTADRNENVRVENGFLHLEARKEEFVCQMPRAKGKTYHYTSGAIKTRSRDGKILKDMSFGSYEIRAKIPVSRGVWPAIWLLGNTPGLHWPQSGEIDIMELVGYEHEAGIHRIHSTLHKDPAGAKWPVKDPGIGMGQVLDFEIDLDQDFHVYRLDWTPEKLEFFIDGKRINSRIINHNPLTFEKHDVFLKSEVKVSSPRDWPYGREIPGQEFHMILNLAIGGDWGGRKGIDDEAFKKGPVEMIVDYVRIYKNP